MMSWSWTATGPWGMSLERGMEQRGAWKMSKCDIPITKGELENDGEPIEIRGTLLPYFQT